MAFVTNESELKPGLVLFRRGNVEHRMWYYHMKIPTVDRYKTFSLKTTDVEVAREALVSYQNTDGSVDIYLHFEDLFPSASFPFLKYCGNTLQFASRCWTYSD